MASRHTRHTFFLVCRPRRIVHMAKTFDRQDFEKCFSCRSKSVAFGTTLTIFFFFCVCFLERVKKNKTGEKKVVPTKCATGYIKSCADKAGYIWDFAYLIIILKIQNFGDLIHGLIHALACTLKEHKVKKFNLPSQEEEPTPTMYQPWSRTVYQELSCALTNASIGCICPSDLFNY